LPSRRFGSLGALVAVTIAAGQLLWPTRAVALTVAGFGDSLTWEPGYLSHLPAEWDTVNLSQGGETAIDGLPRLLGLLPTLEADVVVIMEGTNDVRMLGYSESASVASLTAMIDAVLSAGMQAVLMAPPPQIPYDPDGPAGANTSLLGLATALESAAASRGVPFVDLFHAFAELESLEDFYLDSVHITDAGTQIVAGLVAPAIEQAVHMPEPTTAWLLGAGLALLAVRRRR
jgi:lysophospholipase L1-like esterase